MCLLRLDRGGVTDEPTKPSLTAAGRVHPVTDLAHGTGTNDAAWSQLGAIASVNRVGGLVDGATALLVDPHDATPSGPGPIIAVTDAGVGRTMSIASDSLWRWRFASSKDGGASERAYYRFWSNSLRWLVRDPEHARVRVSPERRRSDLGTPVEVSFTVLGHDYQPVPAANLRVTLSQSGAGTVQLDDIATNDAGAARLRYMDLPAAAYRVRAEASSA